MQKRRVCLEQVAFDEVQGELHLEVAGRAFAAGVAGEERVDRRSVSSAFVQKQVTQGSRRTGPREAPRGTR